MLAWQKKFYKIKGGKMHGLKRKYVGRMKGRKRISHQKKYKIWNSLPASTRRQYRLHKGPKFEMTLKKKYHPR